MNFDGLNTTSWDVWTCEKYCNKTMEKIQKHYKNTLLGKKM